METYPVPYGYKVSVSFDINQEEDNINVIVHAPMYENKTWVMSHSYSTHYSIEDILKDSDFITTLINRYP
jgi:hypothetical protein